MTVNVLHLRDTFEIGGPGKTILETFREIDVTRFRLHLGVFRTRHEVGADPFTDAARACGMPVHEIRAYNQFDPRLISRTASLVRRLDIHIVHAHEVKSDVITWLAALLRPVPIVTTLHGWLGNGPRQRLFTWLDKRVARRFDRVIVVSDLMRRDVVADGVPADGVRLLHNAIVLDNYRRTGVRGRLAELIGTQPAPPIVASVGRLSPEKGHADLIEALGILAGKGRSVTTILVGDGPERQRIESRIAALGLERSVHLTGYLDRPQQILEETDLAVLPSHTEGLPNAALEAMAMEVPVLATAVGGTPEVVTDGDTGRLVPPRSPQALAEAIADFVDNRDTWRAMACRARAAVERQFDFKARTRRLESIYSELAGRP